MRFALPLLALAAIWLVQPSVADAQLRPAQLQSSIRQRIPAMQRCYQALPAQPPGTLRVSVHIQIARSGRVRKVDVLGTSAPPPLTSCIQRELSTMRFPHAKQTTEIVYPLIFRAD